jgi:solute carrier family 25 protein 16
LQSAQGQVADLGKESAGESRRREGALHKADSVMVFPSLHIFPDTQLVITCNYYGHFFSTVSRFLGSHLPKPKIKTLMPSLAISGNHAPAPHHTTRHSKQQPTINKQSWDYVVRSGLAGGIAGCAVRHGLSPRCAQGQVTDQPQAKTVVGPLDRVKILFQASSPQYAKYTGSWFGFFRAMRDIQASEGTRGLFRGHSATLLRIFPYAGIKFLAYEQIRAVIIPDRRNETPIRRLLSGSLAGTISVCFTYPLEVVRVRLAFETKTHHRTTLRNICKTIYNEHPPPPPSQSIPSHATTTTAALARATPLSGLSNFFRGFAPTLLGMIPYAGCSFLTHDTAGDLMRHARLAKYTTLPASDSVPDRDRNKPVPLKYWAELATGGFAGFVSQTVSYPLEVIRRRMQVGGVVGDGHRLGITEVAARIYRETGYKGFFIGLSVGYIKVIPMVAVSFFAYERAKLMLGI